MGRGRSKAKQTKVARELKYQSQEMDIEKLLEELHSDDDEDKTDDEFNAGKEGSVPPQG